MHALRIRGDYFWASDVASEQNRSICELRRACAVCEQQNNEDGARSTADLLLTEIDILQLP